MAGISRVMSSFVEHTQTLSDMPVEMICVSIAPPDGQKPRGSWQKAVDERVGITSLLYEGEIPPLHLVLQHARGLDDVRRAFKGIIDAYQQKLKEEKADVVLINGTYFIPWCLMLAAHRLHLPVVHHYHGSLTKETEHWENVHDRRLMHKMEASFDRMSHKYVFPSALVKDYVEKEVFHRTISDKKSIVLPNPIPDEFFAAPVRAHKKGIAFVGRWTRIKNTRFLDRFAYFNQQEGKPLDIHVVTDKGGKARASKILHNRVEFSGPFTTAKDMARFYASREAILCPSYFETYGNVAQEAVAAGTPAFVTCTMGVSEVFEKIGLGYLVVDFKNTKAFFERMRDNKPPAISNVHRKALQAEVGAMTIHAKLLEFIKQ